MSSNRQKFWTILSKWPITFPKEEYDYGYRLRAMVKSKSEVEEIFPGDAAENLRKLDALMRLVNNKAKTEFLVNADSGACGFKQKEIKSLIEQQLKLQEKTFLNNKKFKFMKTFI